MGVEDRDWLHAPRPSRRPPLPLLILAPIVVVLLVALGTHIIGGGQPSDPENQVHRDLSFGYGPGLQITLLRAPLYPPHDPWKAYLADEQTCPHGEDTSAPLQAQAETMACLINFARQEEGLPTLQVSPLLSIASRLKAEAIERCGVFAHAPCGGDPHDVAVQAGYVGSWGENIYIADGRFGAPRVAMDEWLNSPGHRDNLFNPQWRVHSLYVVKPVSFPGFRNPTLWVSEFGDR